MNAVYTVFTHPVNLCTVEDMIAYVLPKVEHFVQQRYFDIGYDVRQELIQEGIVTLWDEVRRGKLKTTDPAAHWITTCTTGVLRAFEDYQLETGVHVIRNGHSAIEHRMDYDSDLIHDDDERSGLELAELSIHRNPGSCDPDGGKADQRIDFEWLVTKAFSLLNTADVEDCAEIVRHLADGKDTLKEFLTHHHWSPDRYYKSLEHLKDAFYTAAGKERPPKQKNPTTVDAQKVLALYKQGYGCDRIARLAGCSSSRADQIVQAAKKQGEIVRSTKRLYKNTPPTGHAPAAMSVAL